MAAGVHAVVLEQFNACSTNLSQSHSSCHISPSHCSVSHLVEFFYLWSIHYINSMNFTIEVIPLYLLSHYSIFGVGLYPPLSGIYKTFFFFVIPSIPHLVYYRSPTILPLAILFNTSITSNQDSPGESTNLILISCVKPIKNLGKLTFFI
jgi:hypothetical protein